MSTFTAKTDRYLETQSLEHPQLAIGIADQTDLATVHPAGNEALACDAPVNSARRQMYGDYSRLVHEEQEDVREKVRLGQAAEAEREVGEMMDLRREEKKRVAEGTFGWTLAGVVAAPLVAVVDAASLATYTPIALKQPDDASIASRYWPLAVLVLSVASGAWSIAHGLEGPQDGSKTKSRTGWTVVGVVLVVLAAAGAIFLRFRAESIQEVAMAGTSADNMEFAFFIGVQILLSILAVGGAVLPDNRKHRRTKRNRDELLGEFIEQGIRAQDFLDNEATEIRADQREQLEYIGQDGLGAFRIRLHQRMGEADPEAAAALGIRNQRYFQEVGLLAPSGIALPDVDSVPLGQLEPPRPEGDPGDTPDGGDGPADGPHDGPAEPPSGPLGGPADPPPPMSPVESRDLTPASRGTQDVTTTFSDLINPDH